VSVNSHVTLNEGNKVPCVITLHCGLVSWFYTRMLAKLDLSRMPPSEGYLMKGVHGVGV